MPKRDDIKSILVIGSGPIVIGQACEFDYSGAQACKVLREERAVRTTWTLISRPTACPVGSSELTRKGRWRKCPSATTSRAFS